MFSNLKTFAMNSTAVLSSSLLSIPSAFHLSIPCLPVQHLHNTCSVHGNPFPCKPLHPLHTRQSSIITSAVPSNEESVSVLSLEDFVEKDWSFLDIDDLNSVDKENNLKIDRIISAGMIGETSRVLVSIGSQVFVDKLVDSSPCEQLLIVHDSLLTLACIKEKYDKVKCWQGELVHVPKRWAPFDVVFLYFLPALPFQLEQLFGALAAHCLPGARLVISHPQGRSVLELQQQQHPDVIVSSLPDKITLQMAAANYSLQMLDFVDEPGFYLSVLKFKSDNLAK